MKRFVLATAKSHVRLPSAINCAALASLTRWVSVKTLVKPAIEQTKLDAFKIIYVSEKELNPDEITKVKTALVNYVEGNLKLTFERVSVLFFTRISRSSVRICNFSSARIR